MQPIAPPILSPPPKNWLERNWKWLVPVLLVVMFLGILLFAGGIFFGVTKVMKSSEPYRVAFERASSDPRVIAVIGEPIRKSWYMTGQININGPSGHASLAFPVRGPRGKATVYVEAIRRMGEWDIRSITVEFRDSNRRLDLLTGESV
jgi:hypothetical protein